MDDETYDFERIEPHLKEIKARYKAARTGRKGRRDFLKHAEEDMEWLIDMIYTLDGAVDEAAAYS